MTRLTARDKAQPPSHLLWKGTQVRAPVLSSPTHLGRWTDLTTISHGAALPLDYSWVEVGVPGSSRFPLHPIDSSTEHRVPETPKDTYVSPSLTPVVLCDSWGLGSVRYPSLVLREPSAQIAVGAAAAHRTATQAVPGNSGKGPRRQICN